MYLALKNIHLTMVAATIALFVLRGAWMLAAPHLLQSGWVRVVPHLIDTVLLVSAVSMVIMLGQYPLVDGWLTAKLVALVLYVVTGSIALKRGSTRRVRVMALVAALLLFGYIVSVAFTRQPWPWQSLI